MGSFPKLKTGAVAQYPAVQEGRFLSSVHRFADNREQRYRQRRQARRRWRIDLSQLNESEASRLAAFFEEQRGRIGQFDFEDPWSGEIISNCRFDQDELLLQTADELDGRMGLVIVGPAAT